MKDCRISSSIATGTRLLLLWRLAAMRYAPRVSSPLAAPPPRRPPPPHHRGADGAAPAEILDIQVLHAQRVVLDEPPARLDLVAHQRREDLIRFVRVFD